MSPGAGSSTTGLAEPAAWPRATPAQRAELRTVLVTMPFMDIGRPSIQLGLLGAIGRAAGFPVQTLHANLDLAALIGAEDYLLLAGAGKALLGEWVFSVEAFGAAAPDPQGRLLEDLGSALPPGAGAPDVRCRLRQIRDELVPAYLDALLAACPWEQTHVVGFTSSFQQNAASFALAGRLKRRWPHLVVVVGGANVDGVMGRELVRRFDQVDLVVAGEADSAFPRLLEALAVGADPGRVPGVVTRVGGEVVAQPPEPPLVDLNSSPVPDYGEYFDRAQRLGLLGPADRLAVWIPFESARGCWWGDKHHCTFCGLNAQTMQFRAKSPERVAQELVQQARRHGSFSFEAVDNILDPTHLRELFPALVRSAADFSLFYEVKANLTRGQLRLMSEAGVIHIQPGIESLSSHVLELMRKGVTPAQNVSTLRWAQYYGIEVSWNLLWGFPGETAQDYADQAALVPHLVHLRPPAGASRLVLQRYSPLFDDAERFRLRRRSPDPGYAYVYPRDVDLDLVAYSFEAEFEDCLPDAAYGPLQLAVAAWRESWQAGPPPVLTYRAAAGVLHIFDGRVPGQEGTYTFTGPVASVYLACTDRAVGVSALGAELGMATADVEQVLGEFQRRGLVLLDGSRALALALPSGPRR